MIETKNPGKAVGIMQSGYAVGWAFAALTFTLFFAWLPDHYAWPALLLTYVKSVRHLSVLDTFLGYLAAINSPALPDYYGRRLH
jgi:hypothetical protein